MKGIAVKVLIFLCAACAMYARSTRVVTNEHDCPWFWARAVAFSDVLDDGTVLPPYYVYFINCDGTLSEVWHGRFNPDSASVNTGVSVLTVLPQSTNGYRYGGPNDMGSTAPHRYVDSVCAGSMLLGTITFDGGADDHAAWHPAPMLSSYYATPLNALIASAGQ